MADTLLTAVKGYLRISWDDEDSGLNALITRGKDYLNNLTGAELDYTSGLPLSLLLDFCRYSYNNASEYFEENFASEILRLQLQTGVANLPVEEVVE